MKTISYFFFIVTIGSIAGCDNNSVTDKSDTQTKAIVSDEITRLGEIPASLSEGLSDEEKSELKKQIFPQELDNDSEAAEKKFKVLVENAKAGNAEINLVVSSVGLRAAKALKEKFGTPYVIGTPYKEYAERISEALEKKIPMPALEDRKEWEKNTAIEDWKSQIVILIGEPVTTTSFAALIEKEYHYKTKVLCPLEETDGLIGSQDLKVSGEEEMENALKNAQIVVADPLYRPICPAECEFYERAHIAFSGRMFLKNK